MCLACSTATHRRKVRRRELAAASFSLALRTPLEIPPDKPLDDPGSLPPTYIKTFFDINGDPHVSICIEHGTRLRVTDSVKPSMEMLKSGLRNVIPAGTLAVLTEHAGLESLCFHLSHGTVSVPLQCMVEGVLFDLRGEDNS